MPLDDADLEKIGSLIKPLEEKLNTQESTIKKFNEEFPGMSKRHAAEALTNAKTFVSESLGTFKADQDKGSDKGKGKDDPPSKDSDERVNKIQAELDAMKAVNISEKKTNLVLQGLKGIELVEGAAEDFVPRLVEQIEFVDNKPVMKVQQKLETTGEVIDKNVSVDEGIKAFFDKRTWVKKSSFKGGSGAKGSGESRSYSKTPTYDELMKDHKLAGEYQKDHPEEYDKIISEGEAKLIGGK